MYFTSLFIASAASAAIFLLAAGEKSAVLALEELSATMAVPVVAAQALHVARAELAELTSENAVQSAVRHQRAAGRQARRHVSAGGELVMAELHADVCRLQIRRICESEDETRKNFEGYRYMIVQTFRIEIKSNPSMLTATRWYLGKMLKAKMLTEDYQRRTFLSFPLDMQKD